MVIYMVLRRYKNRVLCDVMDEVYAAAQQAQWPQYVVDHIENLLIARGT